VYGEGQLKSGPGATRVRPTKKRFPAIGKCGSIDAHGVSVGARMVFVSSGYTSFGETPGNVPIAYRPKK
jgi:hypothetical protein